MFGFQNRFVEAICNQDGRDWKLIKPIVFCSRSLNRTFIVPRGAATDGASTPAILWAKLPPTGDYWQSAVLHDSAYRNTLLLWPYSDLPVPEINRDIAGLTKANLPKDECDLLLKEAMEFSGVSPATAAIIYDGVKLFGGASFDQARA